MHPLLVIVLLIGGIACGAANELPCAAHTPRIATETGVMRLVESAVSQTAYRYDYLQAGIDERFVVGDIGLSGNNMLFGTRRRENNSAVIDGDGARASLAARRFYHVPACGQLRGFADAGTRFDG